MVLAGNLETHIQFLYECPKWAVFEIISQYLISSSLDLLSSCLPHPSQNAYFGMVTLHCMGGHFVWAVA